MPKLLRVLCVVFGIAIGLALCPGFTAHSSADEGEFFRQASIFAPATVSAAFADDKSDDSEDGDEGDEGEEEEETPIEKAKRLITELPENPGNISEADRAAVEEAQAAYDALSGSEKDELDSTVLHGEKTYGRWLEAAQWGLLALQPIDNTLSLIDGDYSAYVSSASNMGKSTSARSKKWSVVELTVSGEQAWAVIRCNTTSSFRIMRIGGVDYAATVKDDVPEFLVPITVDTTSTFLVTSNSQADYVAVQLDVSLPRQQASSDEISTAKSLAQVTLSGLDDYTSESAAALKAAANALMDAASKPGVTSMELNNATATLNSAMASAQKKSKDDSSSDSSKKSSSSSSSKSKKSKSSASKSSASKSSSASAAKSSSTAARTTTPTAARTTSVVTSTAKKTSSSSASSKSSSSAAAAATGNDTDDGQSQKDVVEVTPVSALDDGFITNAVIVMGVLALMLLGMCARTFLFVRAKEVA